MNYKQNLNPQSNKLCRACGLYLNQLPVLEKVSNPHVFWIGLSAVQFNENKTPLPLSTNTRTGSLISLIENPLKDEINFYRSNLVKCLPLFNGKIRYPNQREMEKCFPNLEDELKALRPSVVFLLGKQVASFVIKKKCSTDASLSQNFKYKGFISEESIFIPIHHPSYILIYKRKLLNRYIKSIQSIIKTNIPFSSKKYKEAS